MTIRQTPGIDLEDLRMDVKEALRQAAAMQFRVIELPAGVGETAPENLSASGRRHLARFVQALGLSLTALSADLPGMRLTDSSQLDERIERTCAVIEMAADMGVPLVTSAVGALTHPRTARPFDSALEALHRIGEFADSRRMIIAIRPTRDSADRLATIFDALRCPNVRLGLDPAALAMAGINPVSPAEKLASELAMVHFRDATAGTAERSGRETRLGEGEVDLRGLISALEACEFCGPLIMRRIDSQTPFEDLASARTLVARLLGGS